MRRGRGDARDFVSAEDAMGPLFERAGVERDGGPFAASKVTPERKERVVAELIWRHQGRGNPVSIAMLTKATGWTDREIKAIVEQLVVTHRMRIGAKRSEPVGYFVVADAEDLAAAVGPYRDQVFAMWRRLRVLMEPRALRELHGQLVLERGPDEADMGRDGGQPAGVPGVAAERSGGEV